MANSRPSSPSSTALLADHSHQSTPLLPSAAEGSASPALSQRSSHTVFDMSDDPAHDYTEKELDDAMAYLDSTRRRSSIVVPSWAKRLTANLSSSYRLVDRKVNKSFLARRALLFGALALILFLTVITSLAADDTVELVQPVAGELPAEKGILDKVVKAPSRIKGAVKEWGNLAWDKAYGGDKEVVYKGLDQLHVMNFDTPQETLKMQLKDGVRYVTSMAYGGHANQFISIQKMLYFAKLTNRVGIIPTLTPVHIDGLPTDISAFYDLDRFYDESGIPALAFSSIKAMDYAGEKPQNEHLGCWSVQEATVGFPNREAWSFDLHDVWIDHWALPPLLRGLGGFDIAFDALRMFDFDIGAKDRWINKVRDELLPQQPEQTVSMDDPEARLKNIKDGFWPKIAEPPTDQVMCFDNTLFLGPVMFHEAFTGELPTEPGVPGEGTSWMEVGQYLRFNKHVETQADEYLMRLFDVATPARIPPFITIHLRRGDFKEFTGFTPLEKYQEALARVQAALQRRLEDPYGWQGPGRAHFRSHGIRAEQYAIVATSDEGKGSDFVKEVKALGWKVLNHEEQETKEKLGGWFPTMLDAAILARGESFVGTDRSTFSHLAGLRVKYWRGGLVETAWRE